MSGFMNQMNMHFIGQNTENGHMMYPGQASSCMMRDLSSMHFMPASSPICSSSLPTSRLPSSCNITIPDPVFRNGRKRSHDNLFDSDIKKSRHQDKDCQSGGEFTFQGVFSWSDGNGTPVSRPVMTFGTPVTPPALPSPSLPLSTSYLEHQFMMNAECHYNRSLMEEIILEAHGC